MVKETLDELFAAIKKDLGVHDLANYFVVIDTVNDKGNPRYVAYFQARDGIRLTGLIQLVKNEYENMAAIDEDSKTSEEENTEKELEVLPKLVPFKKDKLH